MAIFDQMFDASFIRLGKLPVGRCGASPVGHRGSDPAASHFRVANRRFGRQHPTAQPANTANPSRHQLVSCPA